MAGLQRQTLSLTSADTIMTDLSIVIPARDEAETLGPLLDDVKKVIAQLKDYRCEVICVDDHSSDATAEIAASRGVMVIENQGPAGKGMALRSGFQAAKGELFAMLDADYSHRPEDLPVFLDAMADGVGLVIGSRKAGGSDEYTPIRAFGNKFLTAAVGLVMGRNLSDALNGYKIFRKDVFTDFHYTSTEFEIEIEIIANALRKGYRIVEVTSHERARAGGRMKSKAVRHGMRFLGRIFFEGLGGVQSKASDPRSRLSEVNGVQVHRSR
jgi:glycosyltransferase involved in cell wall biosynthesis